MKSHRRGFTLIELLVVIAIIGLLTALLLSALSGAINTSKVTTCAARMHQLAMAVVSYSSDHNGKIPIGPNDPHLFFGTPRHQVASTYAWVGTSNSYEGIGVLLNHYIQSETMIFCPADDTGDPYEELQRIKAKGAADGFSSYLYRQLDQTESSSLSDLGNNEAGEPARALAMDMNSLGTLHPTLFRTNHFGQSVNILYIDGHVKGQLNNKDVFSMDPASADATFFNPSITQRRLDQILVNADYAEVGPPNHAPQLP
jgi:prepilin-type N-terminal cleavage/methylation domain-containing protein/prepilin-type processing-associated H-X9-DG protein